MENGVLQHYANLPIALYTWVGTIGANLGKKKTKSTAGRVGKEEREMRSDAERDRQRAGKGDTSKRTRQRKRHPAMGKVNKMSLGMSSFLAREGK